jgi:hypothetical protein
VEARTGDANYAIEKLNQATQIKNFKDPETYILLGDAYRKLIDGGNAVQSYNKAFALDSKLAEAKYKVGRVYLTQGNKDYFLPAFEEAVTLDPAYKPAYYELFYYWYSRDVNKAAPYLDKFIASADQGPETEYLKTDFLYATSKYAEAKAKAEGLISQYGEKVDPRMYRMVAYAQDTLGDANAAKAAMNTFFTKATPEQPVRGADYEELAKINSKIPGMEAEVFANLRKAVEVDTAVENKVKYITKGAALAKAKGDRVQEGNWLGEAYKLKPNPTQTDLYNYAYAVYQAKNYTAADSLFCGVYQTKYPDQIYGYLWCARAKKAQDDSTNSQGLAVEAYKTLADKARQIDSVKFKAQVLESYYFLIPYYNDIKKDRETALLYTIKGLEFDPTNADLARIKTALEKPVRAQPASPATKPKTTGNAAGTGAGRTSGGR